MKTLFGMKDELKELVLKACGVIEKKFSFIGVDCGTSTTTTTHTKKHGLFKKKTKTWSESVTVFVETPSERCYSNIENLQSARYEKIGGNGWVTSVSCS